MTRRATKKETPTQSYTRDQVLALLKRQIEACTASAEGNCTEYTAKMKVRETKVIEI